MGVLWVLVFERTVVRCLIFLLLSAASALATPLACNPKEDVVICYLKVERNNALDELAIAQGAADRLREQQESINDYWRAWVEGDAAKAAWWDRLWALLPFHTSRR